MKVAVIGANGKIGTHVVEQLQHAKTHPVVAMVRKQAQVDGWKDQGVDARLLDLEGPVSDIEKAFEDIDAVIFTAGSGGATGDDKTLMVDLDGAVKTMEAAHAVAADRFILVSALQAHNREHWNEDLLPYYVAKHYADKELMRSELDWTIVRPGGLTDESSTEKVELAENLGRGTIAREDVARILIRCLDADNTIGKHFDVLTGDQGVEAAVKAI